MAEASASVVTSGRPNRWLRRVGIVTSVAMFIVVTQGDLVTNAGAAQGCGASWPLCHGQIVPTFTPETLIEFSHRLVVGIVSFGILFLAAGTVKRWPRRREVQVLAPALIFFLVLQSVLGGMAVLFPESAPVLALHLGFSLLSLGTVVLTTAFVLEQGARDQARDVSVPTTYRLLAFGAFVVLYVMVYIGAFVRHSQATLGCTGWPLCNGSLLPSANEISLVNYGHRVAAVLGVALFVFLWRSSVALRAQRPDVYRASLTACVALIVQALSGALVAWSEAALWAELVHGAGIALAFAALSYLCYRTLPRQRGLQEMALEAERSPHTGNAQRVPGAT